MDVDTERVTGGSRFSIIDLRGRKRRRGHVDGRSFTARRYKNILAALVVDQGGIEHVTEARLQLCRRFAALAVQAEAMEAKLAAGAEIDLQQHALLSSTLVRIGQRIGLDRVALDAGSMSLRDRLALEAESEAVP
jgi:hypothetical protein